MHHGPFPASFGSAAVPLFLFRQLIYILFVSDFFSTHPSSRITRDRCFANILRDAFWNSMFWIFLLPYPCGYTHPSTTSMVCPSAPRRAPLFFSLHTCSAGFSRHNLLFMIYQFRAYTSPKPQRPIVKNTWLLMGSDGATLTWKNIILLLRFTRMTAACESEDNCKGLSNWQ